MMRAGLDYEERFMLTVEFLDASQAGASLRARIVDGNSPERKNE
jgi:hypothetical protein